MIASCRSTCSPAGKVRLDSERCKGKLLSLSPQSSVDRIPRYHITTGTSFCIPAHEMPEHAYRNSRLNKDSTLPVQEYHASTAPEDYDLVHDDDIWYSHTGLILANLASLLRRLLQDFHFPVKVLESNGVRLEPLIVSRDTSFIHF